VNSGNKIRQDHGGLDLLSVYDGNGNQINASNTIVVSGDFETNITSSGYELTCDRGLAEVFNLHYTININGGPVREIRPYNMNVEVYNGFRAGEIVSEDLPSDGILSPNTQYHLSAVPFPNLTISDRIQYRWHYTFTPSGPGPAILDADITIAPEITAARDATFTIGNVTGEGEIWYTIVDTLTGDTSESPHKLIKVLPKIKIDSPLMNAQYSIDATPGPLMPEIICQAHLEGVPTEWQDNLIFKWEITLTHDFVKIVNGNPITTTISLVKSGEVVGPNEWVIDWGTDFCGGNVLVDCSVLYGEETIKAHLTVADNITVKGTNPNGLYLYPYLRYGFNYDEMGRQMEVIANKESGYCQFYNSGIPKYSGDGGVGMMQITEGSTDPNIFWNWQANVDRGKAILVDKWAASADWFDRQMNGQNHFPPPTCEEELYNTYCLYNGGLYFTADENTKTYIRNTYWKNECGQCNPNNPEADKVARTPEICKQSGCCYADDAMRRH
jgi:hypothetical protein